MTRGRQSVLASALAYCTATAIMGRHLLASLGTHIANDVGDPALNAAILAWNAQNVPWTDAWYQFPIFHPVRDALTFSEHLLGLSPISTPLYWITGSAVSAYNLTVLLTYPLCGLAMYALVWRLTRSSPPAFLAGLAYAFAPYRVVQLAHIQMMALFWAPLALLGLHGFLETRRHRWLALFAVAWALQGATNGYMLVYFSVLVGLWVLWFVVSQGRWKETGLIALAAACAAIPLVPVLVRFVEAHAFNGFRRLPDEVAYYSADVTSIACPDPDSAVWGWFQAACRGDARGEQYLFTGATLVLLCAVGAWLSRERAGAAAATRAGRVWSGISRLLLAASALFFASALSVAISGRWRYELGPLQISSSTTHEPFLSGVVLAIASFVTSAWVRRLRWRPSRKAFYFAAAVAMLMLAWGPTPRIHGEPGLEVGPFAWLMMAPGMSGLRVPARFFVLTVLCLSVLLGLVLNGPLARVRRPWGVVLTAVVAAGLLADGWSSLPAIPLPAGAPAPDRIRGGVALTLPMGSPGLDGPPELQAVSQGWKSANGYSGFEPAHYFAVSEAAGRANPLALLPFVTTADLHVIVPEGESATVAMVEGQKGAALVAARDGRRQYLVPRSGDLPIASPTGARHAVRSVQATCFDTDARRTIDGDLQTRWHCLAQTPLQQLTADLGAPVPVGVVVPSLGPFSSDYPRHLLVETSLDGERWQEAWNRDVYREVFAAARQHPGRLGLVLRFPTRDARYVRLRAMTAEEIWYWSIAELEVWSGE